MSSSEDDSSAKNPLGNIRKLRSVLCHMIDVHHGLLPVLRQAHVLDDDQINQIANKPTPYSATDQLLDVIVELPRRKQKPFLNALFKTGQKHVNNYIVSSGRQPSANEENWPLYGSDTCDHINVKWSELTETLDSVNGLLDELLLAGCISREHQRSIESRETCVGKNEALLSILKRRSIRDYKGFIRCLKTSKQCQIVSLLESNSPGNHGSLSEELKKRLSVSRPALIELIETRNGLLAHLVQNDCITQRQQDSVAGAESQTKRNSILMRIITRGCMSDYEQFVACLVRSGQQHVTRILLEDGVAVRLEVKLGARRALLYSRDTKRSDPYNVARFTSSAEDLRQLLSQEVSLGSDVQLIAIVLDEDVAGLFYLCTSLKGLLHLRELYASGTLLLCLNTSLADAKDKCMPVVDSIDWNMSHYMKCCQYMYHSLGLSRLSNLYSLTRKICCSDSNAPWISVSFERFPPEITETLIIRAAGKLFQMLNIMMPDALLYAMATLCLVSRSWWRTLTHRKYIKRLLLEYCRQVCQPFKRNPHRLTSIHVEGIIAGVAEFCNKLYVACEESNAIQVFDSNSRFKLLSVIRIHELAYPVDIAVCHDTAGLYVADCKKRAVWRVNLLSYKQIDKFISTHYQPYSLSTKSRRLLITSSDGDELFVYGDDGVLLEHIKLPYFMTATHAVETRDRTFMVSHGSQDCSSPGQSGYETVSEVDRNGQVVRSFSGHPKDVGSTRLNQPHYLALVEDKHAIVADHFNKRIVLLDGNMRLKRIWISSLNGQPWRLCFSGRTSFLFVVGYYSSHVLVYHV
jgi:hypothetical protein